MFVNIFVGSFIFFVRECGVLRVWEFLDWLLVVGCLVKGLMDLLVKLLFESLFFNLDWFEVVLVLEFCLFKEWIKIVIVVKIIVEFVFIRGY